MEVRSTNKEIKQMEKNKNEIVIKNLKEKQQKGESRDEVFEVCSQMVQIIVLKRLLEQQIST